MKNMQKIATKVFIVTALIFGVLGITAVLTAAPDTPDTAFTEILMKLIFIDVFVMLPAFALSVAGKYLNGK